MEPATQQIEDPASGRILERQIRECYGRVVYTHKAHEKSADFRQKCATALKHAQFFLSALTTGGLFLTIFGQPAVSKIAAIIAACIATALTILNWITKDTDYGKLADQHRVAAVKLWDVREKYLSLLTDLRSQLVAVEDILQRRDQLHQETFAIYKESPRTTRAGYERARKGLKELEELSFTDEEIDQFLPAPLHMNG